MSLWRALLMPFQLPSLLLVAISCLVLTVVLGVGGPITPFAWLATYIVVVWMNKFSFALLDAAANGETVTPVPSVEMLGPFTDPRSWVHPGLGAGVVFLQYFLPHHAGLIVLAVSLLLFPASLGAIVLSDHLLDALNPLAMWRMLRGFAQYYLLLLLGMALIALLGWLSLGAPLLRLLHYAAIELAFLCIYALLGGMMFLRRIELGFSPRKSPERIAEMQAAQDLLARQRAIDEIFTAVRVRRFAEAATLLNKWFDAASERQRVLDLHAIIEAGAKWSDLRGYGVVLRALITRFLSLRLHAMALTAAEAALKHAPTFSTESVAEALELARYAAHTGRKRLAMQIAGNAVEAAGSNAPAELKALQLQLAGTAEIP
jgi:hypothetical protein